MGVLSPYTPGFDSQLGYQDGVSSLEVKALACEAGEAGALPVYHPKLIIYAFMVNGYHVCLSGIGSGSESRWKRHNLCW